MSKETHSIIPVTLEITVAVFVISYQNLYFTFDFAIGVAIIFGLLQTNIYIYIYIYIFQIFCVYVLGE